MNKPGPKKLYPHKLPVNFTRDQYAFLKTRSREMSISFDKDVSMGDIVRTALAFFMNDTIKASHEPNN